MNRSNGQSAIGIRQSAMSFIPSTDLPQVDIVIQVERLRELCEELFPGRGELFEMIYGSRFDRLSEQFGEDRADNG